MLETLNPPRRVDKAAYEKAFRPLRDKLDNLQRAIFEARIPVAIVFEGWDAAGKGDSIEKLVGRLDPRGYKVHPIFEPTDAERLHPFLWRFWNRIPGRGEIGIFDHSWYTRVLHDRVEKTASKREWQSAYNEINQFERMLTDDGMVMIKFWLQISKKEQKKRFKAMEGSKYDRWRVTRKDWKAHEHYGHYLAAAEEMLERSGSAYAPWTIVVSTDKHYRRLRIFNVVIDALQAALDLKAEQGKSGKRAKPAPVIPALKEAKTVLDEVDLTRSLAPKKFEEELKELQFKLRELQYRCFETRRPVIIACEGWDAAGKGGAIKRIIGSLDPRGYTVVPIAAPKGDEATHQYLWRFWTRIPKAGHITIFDRTWYGRVLVERVEGFANEAEWRRAYPEIMEFERSLTNYGTVLVKFWFHITPEVQLQRFKEREQLDYKRYKITAEDWRNREKWDQYRSAVSDAITNTSTTYAPWTIVEANDKLWARIKSMRTIADAIEKATR
ncbi:MAG TPA: hypothetical protein VGI92_09765 [Gemmatimonadales bacterium]